MKQLIIFLLCLSSSVALCQKSMLLMNGFLHVGNEKTIETAVIGIRNGNIELVRNVLAFSYSKEDWDTIIDLKGQHVYPGFFAANSTLGLTEVDAVRATRDFEEVGTLNPHVRSQIAYNAESKVIATVRTNGVLFTQATPRGGLISGSSSVMSSFGWNWEDASILADDGIHVNWPDPYQWQWEQQSMKKSETYEKVVGELSTFFETARAYSLLDKQQQTDTRLNAMVDCFKGSKRVYFHAGNIQQLLDVIDFSRKYALPFPVIVGGYESYLITRQLKDSKIPVMLDRTHSLPESEGEPVDLPYRLPKLLQDGGVKFCIQPHGDMEAMNARNLPFNAGTAWTYGLTEEQAVMAISLSVCEITGISKNYGSIEEGKSATLFVSKGNALDMRSNQAALILVEGRKMELSNTQQELYQKYLKKYDGQ